LQDLTPGTPRTTSKHGGSITISERTAWGRSAAASSAMTPP
jgi:hypothetical protein